MSTDLDEAIRLGELAKAAATERERAALEDKTWRALPAELRTQEAAKDLQGQFGWSGYEIQCRRDLLMAGEAAEPLWGLIDGRNYALRSLVVVLRRARGSRAEGESLDEAVRRELAIYEATGVERRAPTGKIYRAVNSVKSKSKTGSYASRITRLFDAYLDSVLRDGSPGQERIRSSARTQLRELLSDVERDLKRSERMREVMRSMRKASAKTSRSKLLEACAVLRISAPPPGQLPSLDEVRRKKRILAKDLHPDMHGGDEITRPAFERMIAAATEIEAQVLAAEMGEAAGVDEREGVGT